MQQQFKGMFNKIVSYHYAWFFNDWYIRCNKNLSYNHRKPTLHGIVGACMGFRLLEITFYLLLGWDMYILAVTKIKCAWQWYSNWRMERWPKHCMVVFKSLSCMQVHSCMVKICLSCMRLLLTYIWMNIVYMYSVYRLCCSFNYNNLLFKVGYDTAGCDCRDVDQKTYLILI